MAKKATSKSRPGTKSGSKSTAVAERRSGERRSGERRSSDNGMGEVFIKLLQSPLVAELVAVDLEVCFSRPCQRLVSDHLYTR